MNVGTVGPPFDFNRQNQAFCIAQYFCGSHIWIAGKFDMNEATGGILEFDTALRFDKDRFANDGCDQLQNFTRGLVANLGIPAPPKLSAQCQEL